MFHCQALLEVHDNVAFKKYASPPASPGPTDEAGTMNGFGGQPIRMVGLHKQPKKPLVCPDFLQTQKVFSLSLKLILLLLLFIIITVYHHYWRIDCRIFHHSHCFY